MVANALLDGFRRLLGAPALVAGVFALTFLLAVPFALALRSTIADHLGRSVAADAVLEGVDNDWWQEFTAQASGLGTTFTPSVIGFAAVLENIGGLLDNQARIAPIAAALAAYLLGWTAVSGGIIDRYARQRPTHAHGFFAACGVYFFRFLRLGAVAVAVYAFLFIYVHDWIFADWLGGVTRGLASERAAMLWRFAMYIVFGALLVAANVLFDYTRIRAVVEDRRSMVFALAAGGGFVWRHKARVLPLYAANAALFLLLLALWAMLAPGVTGPGLSMWLAFAGGQVYLLARLMLKLHVIASETALFQGALAHARYVAAPRPRWPEAPVVETMA